MDWLTKHWKHLAGLLSMALMIAAGSAYLADCDGVGDALKRGAELVDTVGEMPDADTVQPEPAPVEPAPAE